MDAIQFGAREGHLPLLRELIGEGLAVRIRVAGKSMAPHVSAGDLITLRSVRPSAIRLGDLVLSQEPGLQPVVHRVVSRRRGRDDSWAIRTKGDAVRKPEAPVRGEHVVGRVVAIHRELPSGACLELELDSRRPLGLLIAVASRFAPRLFAAFSRRLQLRLGPSFPVRRVRSAA